MKTLIVYVKDSVFKYPNLFQDFTYEINPNNGVLLINKQTRESQYEEMEHAAFRNWDYYQIEEIKEDE